MRVMLITAVLLLGTAHAQAEVVERTAEIAGVTVNYTVVLPDGYDSAREYPAVLAFSGGSQSQRTVEMDLRRNWRAQAERRGYLVFIAAAPEGQVFFRDGGRIFPGFLERMRAEYPVLDDRFHVAGPSNGGISAFTIAAAHPEYFVSVTGFPGYLPNPTPARMQAIAGMCLYMFAGERDRPWAQMMDEQSRAFRAAGMHVQAAVEQGQPHLIDSLAGQGAARLFDQFDAARRGC